jgi:tetratricopeptide (TPR) repeat protein
LKTETLKPETKLRVRLNKRALVVATILGVIAIPAVLVGWRIQNRRLGAAAVALAQEFEKAEEPDKAIRHLSRYVEIQPDDRKALGLLARLLAESARSLGDILHAASVNEQYLRLDPNAPDSQDTRRRLVELYVRFGDLFKLTPNYGRTLDRTEGESRAAVAETIAEQLFVEGRTNIPKDFRLLGQAKEGMIAPGSPKALGQAVENYQKALKGDPTDAIAAAHLAQIYLQREHNPEKARKVLDDLLKASETAEVRLVRYRFFTLQKDRKQAALELAAARELAPKNVLIRVMLAEEALKRGDTAAAKSEIDALPNSLQKNTQVQLMKGRIAFAEQHPDKAISDWQQGLLMTNGTDAQLTWQLAYAYLQTGNLTKARPLMARYRELGGDGFEPLLAMLKAEFDLRSGWPARAAYELERIRSRISEAQKVPLLLTLGHAYEGLWDDNKALEAYHEASEINPEAQEPRISAIRLWLRRQKFDKARAEVERGLKEDPDAPSLLVLKARLLLMEQARLPRERRSWTAFIEALKQASERAPNSPDLALLHTDFLSLQGNTQEAIRMLKTIVDKHPKIDTIAIAYANSLARAGQVDEALQVLDEASSSEKAGDLASLRINRANLLLGLGRGRTARAALVEHIEGLQSVTEQTQVWRALGQLEASQGDLSQARNAYLECARLLPDDPQPRLDLLVLAMNSGDEELVRKTVADLRERSPERNKSEETGATPKNEAGSRDLIWELCRVQEILWKSRTSTPQSKERDDSSLEEARDLLEKILLDAPEMPIALILHGDVLERLNKLPEAAKEYQHAWDLGADTVWPRLATVLTRLGQGEKLAKLKEAAIERGDPIAAAPMISPNPSSQVVSPSARPANNAEEPVAILEEMVKKRPDDLETWLRLVRSYSLLGDVKEVTSTIERIKTHFKAENPDLIEARCRWAANDIPRADALFKTALERSKYDPTVSRFASEYYVEQGRRSEAAACLQQALKAHPEDRPTARTLAVLLASAASDERSWTRAYEVLGPEPKEGELVEDRVTRAVVLSYAPVASRKEEAIKKLEDLVSDIPPRSPHASLARGLLARLLIKAGRGRQAAEVASISANSGSDPAAIGLYAEALIQAREWKEAQYQIDRLMAFGPRNQRAAQLQVQLIQTLAGPDKAVKALEQALDDRAKMPDFATFEREVVSTLDQIGPSAVKATRDVAKRIAAKNPASAWILARLEYREGHFTEALNLCRQVVASGTLDDLLQVGEITLQIALTKKTDPRIAETAEAVLQEAQTREPKNNILLICRAMVAHLKGRYEDEIRFYRELLKRQPANAVALNNIAWSLSEGINQPSEALTYIEALVEQGGRSAQSLDTRGVILSRLGRHDEAIRDLLESNRLAPSDQTVFHLALALHAAGREEEFRRYRDAVRKAGLKPEQLDATELPTYESLIKP